MHRFFIKPEAIHNTRALLRGPIVHQIRDVLRMHPGDAIILLDNSGWAYRAELITIDRDTVRGRVVEKWLMGTEPATHITLYQGILKGQKFDSVLQKGTELGITAFVPILAARCIVSSVDNVSNARIERWQKIIAEAAEQAGRASLPRLLGAELFVDACATASREGLSLIPWEGEHTHSLREALHQAFQLKEIKIFVGPEGGFTEEEITTAKGYGIIPVSLGPRIFRAETAGLVAAAAILYEVGDLG